MNYKQKKQIIDKGKELDAMAVRHRAERLGVSPKMLANYFECTLANISKAYKGENSFRLCMIDEYLSSIKN